MVGVRLTAQELERVQRAAAQRGMTVAGYMRGQALREAGASRQASLFILAAENATYTLGGAVANTLGVTHTQCRTYARL